MLPPKSPHDHRPDTRSSWRPAARAAESTFTVGALGAAAALGLGNGAVFKLVPEHFPKETGAVTGLVGAFGGLGGFFPPLVLGVIRDATGGYAIGFVLLALSAIVCLLVNYFVFIRGGPQAPAFDQMVTTGS